MDRFKGEDSLNSETAYVDASLIHSTEKTLLQMAFNYTRDTPLTSEVQQSEVVFTNKVRHRWSVNPIWSYQLNERNSLSFNSTYLDVKHQDAEQTGLLDYKYVAVYTQHSVSLSEFSKLNTKIYGSRLDANKAHNQTDDGGVDLILNSKITQNDTYSIHVGWHQVTLRSGLQNRSRLFSRGCRIVCRRLYRDAGFGNCQCAYR